ncbi:hypothetical protein [Paludibacterium paludis]|uniref:Uncharacterized protein n=1 Tax=Paludibacterium paludis TaxID=1225769 RepID=A0A918P557_9NEIS|nr:hypothetical protein [Paludibacterium paludis]GGY20780.1 hypothetical protein GCM10011289_25500 [Paludibacterium paludis]
MQSRPSRQQGSILLETGLAIGLIGLAVVAAWHMIGDAHHESSIQHLGQYQQQAGKTMIRYLRARYADPVWKTAAAANAALVVRFDPSQAASPAPVYPQTGPNAIARIGQDLLPLGMQANGPRGASPCMVVFGADTTANLPLRGIMITHLNATSDADLELAARLAGPTTGVVHADAHGKLSASSGAGGWALDDLAHLPGTAACSASPGDLISAFAVTQSEMGTPESALWRVKDGARPQHNAIDTVESGENHSGLAVIDPASPGTALARLDDSAIEHARFVNLTGQGAIPSFGSLLQTQSVTAGNTTAGNQRVQFLPDNGGSGNLIQNPDGPLSLYADGFVGYNNVSARSAQGLGGHHFPGATDTAGAQGALPGLSLSGFLQLGTLPAASQFPTLSATRLAGFFIGNNWTYASDWSSTPKPVAYPDLQPYMLGRTVVGQNDYNEGRGLDSTLNPANAYCDQAGVGSIMMFPNSPQIAVCMPGAPDGHISTSNYPYTKTSNYDKPTWQFMLVLGTPYNPSLLPRALAWSTWASRQERQALPLLSAYSPGERDEPGTESALKLPEQYSKHGGPQKDDAYENDWLAGATSAIFNHKFVSILAEPDGEHTLDNICDGTSCTNHPSQTTGVPLP